MLCCGHEECRTRPRHTYDEKCTICCEWRGLDLEDFDGNGAKRCWATIKEKNAMAHAAYVEKRIKENVI